MAKTVFIPDEDTKELTIAIGEKYLLTIKEASAYFNMGLKKIRRLAENNLGSLSVCNGNKYLIIRPKFEEYICQTSTL